MAGLTDRDLRRIKRFVETPPRQRTPHILTPDGGEEHAVLDASDSGNESDAEAEPDVETTG